MNFRKLIKSVTVAIMLCMLVFTPMDAESHSGRLDANGGHYNRKTGEYHYHRGPNSVSKSRSTRRRKSTKRTRRTRHVRSRSRRR